MYFCIALHFTDAFRPLSTLIKKSNIWRWIIEENTFNQLKSLLTTTHVLQQADLTILLIINGDASSHALGECRLHVESLDKRLAVDYSPSLNAIIRCLKEMLLLSS